jgi:hypothetical protein
MRRPWQNFQASLSLYGLGVYLDSFPLLYLLMAMPADRAIHGKITEYQECDASRGLIAFKKMLVIRPIITVTVGLCPCAES